VVRRGELRPIMDCGQSVIKQHPSRSRKPCSEKPHKRRS
jgi:hypothetical protein